MKIEKVNLCFFTNDVFLKEKFIDICNNIKTVAFKNRDLFDFNNSTNLNEINLPIWDIEQIVKSLQSSKDLFSEHNYHYILYDNNSIDFDTINFELKPLAIINKLHSNSQIKIIIENAINNLINSNEMIAYKSVFEVAKDAAFVTDSNGNILYWNYSSERIYGWDSSDIINKNFIDLILPEHNKQDFIIAFADWKKSKSENFKSKTIELYFQKKNEQIFPVELTMVKFEQSNLPFIAFYSRDITEIVNTKEEIDKLFEEMVISKEIIEQNANELVGLNHELYESQMQLKDLNASKDKFFSIIAHDLKGPFQNLIGYTDLLSKDIKHLDIEDIEELATSLHLSAVQLFKLLENLLHWARIQRGAIEYSPEKCPLYLLLNQNIYLVKPRADEKNIKLICNIEEDIEVYTDVNMLNTVIRNLLSNSLKFTPENGQIEVSSYKFDDKYQMISIRDNGVGIPEEKISKLFRIDQSVSTLGTNNEQGTGLGLILCKDLVEKNGGQIFVESRVGEGTTFKFTVPINQ